MKISPICLNRRVIWPGRACTWNVQWTFSNVRLDQITPKPPPPWVTMGSLPDAAERAARASGLQFRVHTVQSSEARVEFTGPLGRRSAAQPLIIALLAALWLARRRWPRSPAVKGLRETVPLAACFLIYTNLHDTIGFVNPHDVHLRLVALDQAIFGVQPCVWAERFISPGRTELMQFCYLSFFWIAPSTSSGV